MLQELEPLEPAEQEGSERQAQRVQARQVQLVWAQQVVRGWSARQAHLGLAVLEPLGLARKAQLVQLE